VAAGWVGAGRWFKTGHGVDHRVWREVERPTTTKPRSQSIGARLRTLQLHLSAPERVVLSRLTAPPFTKTCA
jgi:hypothetical protein